MTDEELAKVRRYADQKLVQEPRFDTWIEMAEDQLSRSYFGTSYCLAVALLVSHMGVLETTKEDASHVGSVSSISEGGISISYSASGAGTDDDLLQTTWGRQFLNLRNSKRIGPNITGRNFGFFGGFC